MTNTPRALTDEELWSLRRAVELFDDLGYGITAFAARNALDRITAPEPLPPLGGDGRGYQEQTKVAAKADAVEPLRERLAKWFYQRKWVAAPAWETLGEKGTLRTEAYEFVDALLTSGLLAAPAMPTREEIATIICNKYCGIQLGGPECASREAADAILALLEKRK